MGSYKNNKDGTSAVISTNIQVVNAPMEEFLSRGEFNAITPNDVGTQNKLVAENEVTKAFDTMPTASSSLVGTIVQYVGTTTANYTNGYFYKCVSDGTITPTYSWEEIISGGGGADLPWVTPQDYGAVGDGVTDDTTAIQAAFDAVRANGGTVYFPKGVYIVSTTLSIPSNTTMVGERGNAVIKVSDSIHSDMNLVEIGSTGNPKHDINIEGLIFRGSELYGDDSHGISLVDVRGSTNITFTDCIFQNNMYAAIRLINGASNIKVFSCRFEATDCCVASFGDDKAVSDVTIRNCHFTGISSYNNFHNTASECAGTFTSPSAGVSRRWVIEDCIFEQKKTNAISFNVHSATSSSGILIEDCVVRNCTFRATLGGVLVYHSKNVTIDGLAFDDTAIAYPDEMYIQSLIGVQYSDNVTIRNVTSTSTKVRQPLSFISASNCLVENIDTYVDLKESSPLHYMFVNRVDKSIFRNFTIRPIDADNKQAVIQLKAITNSYVEILSNAKLGSEVNYYFETIANVTDNIFVGDTEGGFLINGASNTTTASSNQWRKLGQKLSYKSDLNLNQYQIAYAYSVKLDNQSAFDAALAKANIPLFDNGAEMIVRFTSSTFSKGKAFSFNTTGNLIPINKPFVISDEYTVVCHFIQKRAKWVEVERTLEYYEGADVNVMNTLDDLTDVKIASATNNEILAYDGTKWKNENGNVAFIHDKNLLQLPDGTFSINNVNLSIKDNIITLNSTNITTNRIYIKLTNGIALSEGSAPTSWRSETINFMEVGKTYGIRDFSFGGTTNDTGMAASVRDSSGTSILSRSKTNPVQISVSPAYIQLYIESNSFFVDYKVGVSITENEIPQDWGDIVAYKDYWKQYISQCFLDTENFIDIGSITGYVTQGMCTDGTYLYACLIDNASDLSNTYVYKYNLVDGSLVTSVHSYSLGHCNSMTYTPNGYIFCVALDNVGTIHIINSSDLSYVDSFTIDLSDVYSAYTGIGAISYNASRDVFVCLIRGSRRGYAILDRNFNLLDLVWTRNFYNNSAAGTAVTYGSCFSDDNFIYQVTYNYDGVQVFTYNGDYVGNIILPSVMYNNELEDISIDGENVYISIQQSNTPHIAKLAIHDKRYACVLKR